MKKILLLILFLLISYSAKANVYSDVAYKLSSVLHIVKGRVIGVNGQVVKLDKGYKDGLYEGSLVYIYRNKGKLILFGSNQSVELKKGVAYACVKEVNAHTSQAVLTGGLEKIKNYLIGLGIIPWGERQLVGKPHVGDRFIAGKKEYRVAIITRNPIIFSSLKSSLEKTGRFYIINPDRLAIAIMDNRINYISREKSIRKLAESVDADLVVLVSSDPKYKKLNCRVYNGYGGVEIISIKEPIDRNSRVVLINNSNLNSIPPNNIVASNLRLSPRLTFWQKLLSKVGLSSPYTPEQTSSSTYRVVFYKDVGYGTTAFYVGDVNADGYKEILVGQGSKVSIYAFSAGAFKLEGNFNYGYNIFHIDSAKFGDKTLVSISNYNSYGSLDSAIGYIGKDYKFHTIKGGLAYNIRFYNRFDRPVVLLQKASIDKPFYGPIYELDLRTNRISRFKLPVKSKDLFTFEKIDNYIAYLSRSGQLCLYDTDSGKVVQETPFAFGGGERPIERYHYQPGAKQTLEEVEAKNQVYIPDGIGFFKQDNKIYALGYRNYMSSHITLHSTNYNAYTLRLLRFDGDKFTPVWNSGDLKGHMIGCGKVGDYIVSVVGLPAGFFDRFIRGVLEVDRLTAAQMEH